MAVTALLFVSFLFVATSIRTQSTATLPGYVFDASVAVVASTTITVRSLAANYDRAIQANADGRYHIAEIPAGEYEVAASAAGCGQE